MRNTKLFLPLFLMVLLLGGKTTISAESNLSGMRLFLLIGQSNMAGRGLVTPQDEVTHPRIFMLTKEGEWVPAKDPLHFDKPIAGTGLASEFARILAREEPTARIGLIPCAMGGSSLDQWKPGAPLYVNAIQRARIAMENGAVSGILWHQGEADSSPEKISTYATRFASMIAQLRKDLGAEDVPVVIGELGRFREESRAFNENLPEVVRHVPKCALVSAEDLTDKGDKVHFDAAALRTFGQRYAEAFRKLSAMPGEKAAQKE
jgi:hypothetical protein